MPENLNRSAYPSIPARFWRHYDRLLSDQPQHRLLEAILRQGAERTLDAINTIFFLAATATALQPDELLLCLGFQDNDLDPANFQAMLAVLRTINKLHELEFVEIKPLRPSLVRREADLLAVRNDKLYSIEVFRSAETASRLTNHEHASVNLASYVTSRVQEKLPQVRTTMREHNCEAGIVVIVMDSQPSRALDDVTDYLQAVTDAFQRIGSPQDIHILLFTAHDEQVCHPPLS